MREEPLFVRLANRNIDALGIIQSFRAASPDEESIKIAAEAEDSIPDISVFIKDFREVLGDLIDNGANQRVINYLNSYMKPSLSEIVDSTGSSRAGENRQVFIKDAKAPWVEAVVCYNLSLYIKAFGLNELKNCPVCSKFFTNKGKYSIYCSDICKNQGSGNG
jgi:hypothetical protein